MHQEVLDLLNTQIVQEAKAAQAYLGLSISISFKGYAGFGEFFRNRSEEERTHMMKLVDYIDDREGLAKTPQVDTFDVSYPDIEDYFFEALTLEKETTRGIIDICVKCNEVGDFTTLNFLQWFLTEQQEEEALFQSIMDKFSILDKNKTGIYMLQQELLDADNNQKQV